MTARIAICGLLLLAAGVVAYSCGPREHRRMVAIASSILLGNWALYASSWATPAYSPAQFAWWLTGIDAQPREMWALIDAMSASAIVIICIYVQNRCEKWCLALWALLLCQIVTHGLVRAKAVEVGQSFAVLDFFFFGQIAVFLFIGRKGVSDVVRRLVHHLDDRRGNVLGSLKAALFAPPKRKG